MVLLPLLTGWSGLEARAAFATCVAIIFPMCCLSAAIYLFQVRPALSELLPYLLGERAPRWNPNATAAWLGLKMENERSDIFRSVMEGVTLNLNIILESFRRSIPIDELLIVGGGAKGKVWCQMLADVFNARIKVPALLEEATSMGAAVTGGVGAGIFKDFTAIDQMLELNQELVPDPAAAAAYGPVKETFEACYQALLPVYERMAGQSER